MKAVRVAILFGSIVGITWLCLGGAQPHASSRQYFDDRPQVHWPTFSADGRLLAYVTNDGRIVLREVLTGRVRAEIDSKAPMRPTYSRSDGKGVIRPGPLAADTWGLALCPRGRYLAIGILDKRIKVYDLKTEKLVSTILSDFATTPGFSVDGTSVVLAQSNWNKKDTRVAVHFHEPATGKLKHQCKLGRASVSAIAYSPDGKTLATMNKANRGRGGQLMSWVSLWSLCSAKLPREFEGVEGSQFMAFSPDWSQLAVTGVENEVHLYSVATGKKIRELTTERPVLSLAYSPDGKTLAVGGTEGRIRFWDLSGAVPKKGRLLRCRAAGPVYVTRGTIKHVSFSADGRFLAALCCSEPADWNPFSDLTVWDLKTGRELGWPRQKPPPLILKGF